MSLWVARTPCPSSVSSKNFDHIKLNSPLTHHVLQMLPWHSSEWARSHFGDKKASLSGRRGHDFRRGSGRSRCGWRLRRVVEVLLAVPSYLNWRAASAATWLNSRICMLVGWGESWQEGAWESLGATSAPYPPWRVMLWQPAVLHKSPYRLDSRWNAVVGGR